MRSSWPSVLQCLALWVKRPERASERLSWLRRGPWTRASSRRPCQCAGRRRLEEAVAGQQVLRKRLGQDFTCREPRQEAGEVAVEELEVQVRPVPDHDAPVRRRTAGQPEKRVAIVRPAEG